MKKILLLLLDGILKLYLPSCSTTPPQTLAYLSTYGIQQVGIIQIYGHRNQAYGEASRWMQ